MTLIGQPLPLVAMGLFLALLSFNLPYDVPLALFALAVAVSFPEVTAQQVRAGFRQHWSVLLFVLAAMLSGIFSVNVHHSALVNMPLLPALMCYFTLCLFAADQSGRRFVLYTLLALGYFTLINVLCGYYREIHSDPLAQVRSLENVLLVVPNDILLLAIIAPLILALWTGATRGVKMLIVLYLLSALITTILLQSRQAAALLLLGVALYGLFMFPRRLLLLAILALMIALLTDAMRGWLLWSKVTDFSRAYVWHTAWVMFLDHPWLGMGPGEFKDAYTAYLAKAGYLITELPDRRLMPWAHNLYLEQLAERGVLGFMALIALFVTVAQRLYQGWQSAQPDIVALVVACIMFALAGIGELTLQRLWVVVLMLVLAGLSVGLPQQNR